MTGLLKIKCTYVNDTKQGEYLEYYVNNKLRKSSFFINGRRNGEYKEYYKNGKPKLICNFNNGVQEK